MVFLGGLSYFVDRSIVVVGSYVRQILVKPIVAISSSSHAKISASVGDVQTKRTVLLEQGLNAAEEIFGVDCTPVPAPLREPPAIDVSAEYEASI